MVDILSLDEIKNALRVDADFDKLELTRYQKLSTSFVFERTGYQILDTATDKTIHPLVKQLATLYVKSQFYSGTNYNKDYDYTLGINSLISDIQLLSVGA